MLDAPRQENTANSVNVQTLLRRTVLYLEAIRDGLDSGIFAETFDHEEYGPLWDMVHDGCVHLLTMLDGEPDEPEEPVVVKPADIPPYDATKFVLGKLCVGNHQWGQTGQTLLRINGKYCQRCNTEHRRTTRRQAKAEVGA